MAALLDGVPFRIDPDSVHGGFRVKTNAQETIGGRVVQVFGTTWDDLTVSGSFGRGGVREQAAMVLKMTAMGEGQVNGRVMKFIWPEKGWNFAVALKSYTSPDGPMSAHVENKIINPKWTLTFFVVEDSGGLKTAADGEDAFIARLFDGIGWHQTIFNGPDPDWASRPPEQSTQKVGAGGQPTGGFVTGPSPGGPTSGLETANSNPNIGVGGSGGPDLSSVVRKIPLPF